MESEQEYLAYQEVLLEENLEYLKTIPLSHLAEYLVTFDNWHEALPTLYPSQVVDIVYTQSLKDIAYYLVFNNTYDNSNLQTLLQYIKEYHHASNT